MATPRTETFEYKRTIPATDDDLGTVEYGRIPGLAKAAVGCSVFVKVSGTWMEVESIWVKISGIWTGVLANVKVSGVWNPE